jgi:hypothetical protein
MELKIKKTEYRRGTTCTLHIVAISAALVRGMDSVIMATASVEF